MLRSIAHELVHHHQNERGDFENCGAAGDGYAQEDEHLRNMEKEAYLKGNMLFRDWEDSCKKQMQMEDNNKMKLSELKELIKETIKDIVKEGWGGSDRKNARFIGDDDAKYKERNPGRNHHIPQKTNADACLDKYPMMGLDYRECLKGLKEADGEQQIEEGDCGSGKREDKKSKKKCPHCDGNAPESECINKPQKKSVKEGEEVEQQIDEAGCGSHGKREDKKSKKKCPHCDGDAPESECINKPQKKSMKEGEESKVMTPEKEKALKENYMGEKRNRLFEKLTKKWTK
jgi:hypothetical protein